MVQNLDYTTVRHVIDTWESLRRQQDYEITIGRLLFQRLFEKCPECKVLFGFTIDCDPQSPLTYNCKRFTVNASYHIQMLDTALTLLGTDIELISEIMQDLANKHIRYGVTVTMFQHMTESLIETLRDQLSTEEFSEEVQRCWKETFQALIEDMIVVHH